MFFNCSGVPVFVSLEMRGTFVCTAFFYISFVCWINSYLELLEYVWDFLMLGPLTLVFTQKWNGKHQNHGHKDHENCWNIIFQQVLIKNVWIVNSKVVNWAFMQQTTPGITKASSRKSMSLFILPWNCSHSFVVIGNAIFDIDKSKGKRNCVTLPHLSFEKVSVIVLCCRSKDSSGFSLFRTDTIRGFFKKDSRYISKVIFNVASNYS